MTAAAAIDRLGEPMSRDTLTATVVTTCRDGEIAAVLDEIETLLTVSTRDKP
jgi:hypothetical protein